MRIQNRLRRGRPMTDSLYLQRVEDFLREALEVSERELRDGFLAHEIQLELARLADKSRFPVTMLRMLAPDGSPAAAARALFVRLIYRSIAARDLASHTPLS